MTESIKSRWFNPLSEIFSSEIISEPEYFLEIFRLGLNCPGCLGLYCSESEWNSEYGSSFLRLDCSGLKSGLSEVPFRLGSGLECQDWNICFVQIYKFY